MTNEEKLMMLIDEASEYASLVKDLEKMIKANKAEIKKLMDESGVKDFSTNSYHRCQIVVSERSSVDSKRLKEEKPEIFEEFKKTSHVESMRIS